jgi:hypothetical protein
MQVREGSEKERRRAVAFVLGFTFGIARVANLIATRRAI